MKRVARDGTVALIERARRGDDAAFERLLRQEEPYVYRLAWQLTGNREDALDVSQEAFLHAWRNLSGFRGDCSFRSWLLRIARNAALDLLRQRARYPVESMTVTDARTGEEIQQDVQDEDVSANPPQAYDRKETVRAVRQALDRLEEDQREILLLREFQGYSYTEIAELLQIEMGTVKSRLARARDALRAQLKGFL